MTEQSTTVPLWMRATLWFSATRVGAWLLTRTLPRLDRALLRLSDGDVSIARVISALGGPVIQLTTIGAKTGKERTVPVFGLRDGDRWVVLASNWGRERHPAWYHNLRANPELEVTFRGDTGEYVAREATGEERERYLDRLHELNPAVDTYQSRSGDRPLPVMLLSPADDEPDTDEADH